MSKRIAVIGAGAWGGWSAFKLQEAGFDVTLIDKSTAGNTLSGSGGKTRIIRMAYGGHERYTEMVDYAFKAWKQYSEEWQEQLYHPKGALWLFRGIDPHYAKTSIPLMKERGFSLSEMGIAELEKKYPLMEFEDVTSAYWEPYVWYLEAGKSCSIVVNHFQKLGGKFIQSRVNEIESNDQDCTLKMDGKSIAVDQVIVACGPWAKELIPELKDLIHVTRHEVYYFEAPKTYNDLPIWVEFREGDQMYYGIPDDFGEGFKFAYDERQWALDPDKDERGVKTEILEKMKAVLVNRFPDLKDSELVKYHTCVYENSIDGDFIIDTTGNGKVIYMAGSSGHGFKMGPAIGQMALDYIKANQALPKEFSVKRFTGSSTERRSQYQL